MKNKYILVVLAGLFVANTANAASLDLVASNTNIQNGESVVVDVLLDTEGVSIDGVDFYSLRFDPEIFSAELTPGSLMPNTVYNQVEYGAIMFSQVTEPGTRFVGSGTLATVTLTAKNPGISYLEFDFIPGSTIDTNVASEGMDVLASANGLNFAVESTDSFVSTLQSLFTLSSVSSLLNFL